MEENQISEQKPAYLQEMQEIISQLKDILQTSSVLEIRQNVEEMKVQFYRKHNSLKEEKLREFVASGGEEQDFVFEKTEQETKFKELLENFRTRKEEERLVQRKVWEENLAAKKELLAKFNALTAEGGDIAQNVEQFNALRGEWNKIGDVPPENQSALRKEYSLVQERIFDLKRINYELMEYDFKKNLEIKTAICEKAEALLQAENPTQAASELQNLHEQWHETGPVEKSLREEIWERFRAASSAVNKRQQEFNEARKAEQEANLLAKTALCVEVENFDLSTLQTMKLWDEAGKKIIALQEKWRTIGAVPHKENVKIYKRFQEACNKFFKEKSEYFKAQKERFAENLRKKEAICEKAEALKNSTDWATTAKEIADLQAAWKEIGAVHHKFSDAVWARFRAATTYFFEQRAKAFEQKNQERAPQIEQKKVALEQVKNFQPSGNADEDFEQLVALVKNFNSVQNVPRKVFLELQNECQEFVNPIFEKLKQEKRKEKLDNFSQTISGKSYNQLTSKRASLQAKMEEIQRQINQYERNLSFFRNSKNAEKLTAPIEKNVEKLRAQLAELGEKIKIIKNKE